MDRRDAQAQTGKKRKRWAALLQTPQDEDYSDVEDTSSNKSEEHPSSEGSVIFVTSRR